MLNCDFEEEVRKRMNKYFKLARPDGFDFYTAKTINYRENVGKWISVSATELNTNPELCSKSVIHASKKINDCFVGAWIPCSAYRVQGTPVIVDVEKCGFKRLFVSEEISHETFNSVFGWNILEAENPVNPLKIMPPEIGEEQIKLLREWASVRDSVGAYIGSLFPNIQKWKFIEHKAGEYPFKSAATCGGKA